ncbi:hypothetical protein BGZ83_003492, partial [Gryganskiella cystojenkinii]
MFKANAKLSEVILQAENRLRILEQAPHLSNKKLSRLKAFLSRTVFPLWIQTRGIDPRATKAVAKELHDTHGWTTHVCPGQFDLCAGRMSRAEPESKLMVVTTDSDLLFMGVHSLVRFRPQGAKFYLYPIKSVIQHCGLKSIEEWVASAILAKNDYDPSVARTSFASALKEVTNIRNSRKGKKNVNQTVESYVRSYCDLKGVSVKNVQNSLESFVQLNETTLETFKEGDDPLDDSVRRIIFRVQALQKRTGRPFGSKASLSSASLATPRTAAPLPSPTEQGSLIQMLDVASGSSQFRTGFHNSSESSGTLTSDSPNSLDKPTGTARSKGFHRYLSAHVYRPKTFLAAFSNAARNNSPVSVKDKTIGRIQATDLGKDNDDDDLLLDEYQLEDGAFDFPDDDTMVPALPKEDLPTTPDITEDSEGAEEGGQVEDAKAEANPSKKPRKSNPKVTFAKSSRRVRDVEEVPKENIVPRRTNPTNMIGDAVASKHPLRAMTPGRVHSTLSRSLKHSFPEMNDKDRSLLRDHVAEVLSTLARVNSSLLREGLMATELYIADVFNQFPAIDGDLAKDHAESRRM